ncbi:MBL fold metallo-hydrolase [Parasphingorhabdus cellanae]|uniref:MBL fold metallo-hydrolase n=1 Tax=Parasphingorhabdus cellanae TaxID=2806553 RepID=A0ABX7T5X3_9SPHN|nr:MBL fold metallo-hydrolase [Parasphingorhabdus cellanae]QTD56225.1 MBL fold metallo-hydrolase [Parasphingorhabdus cellanae]
MSLKLIILGCGTSSGVPRIGNDWGDCDPNEPKNRRTRVSIIVESPTTRILVDTSPDLRAQFLACDIDAIDHVIWTHDHADHCHGIDDLRQVFQQKREPIPAYARSFALESLKQRFAYAFEGHKYYPSICDGRLLETKTEIGDIVVKTVDQPHGGITSAGLRFEHNEKSISYATDFGEVTEDMRKMFRGSDIFVVDALREKPHPTHAHLNMTRDFIDSVKPRLSLLTHMDKSMDYNRLCAILPKDIQPAYDGLVIEI